MTYDVLKEHTDKEFKVRGDDGEKAPLHLEVGATFIPAKFNYPANKVAALVADGTLKLIVREPPEPTKAEKAAAKADAKAAKADTKK